MAKAVDILQELEKRRRELHMSCEILAQRSHTSLRTVQRVLQGEESAARLTTVTAIAEALGVDLGIARRLDAQRMRRQEADRKARRLVAMSQGTAVLEEQGVSTAVHGRMRRKIAKELLTGPAIRLWSH